MGPPVSESGGHGARATCHPDVIAFFFFLLVLVVC